MLPTYAQVNHDLNLLYCIARTCLPKEVLEALMYGGDYDEPTREDLESIKQLVEANKNKGARQKEEISSLSIEVETTAEGLWQESITRDDFYNSIYE